MYHPDSPKTLSKRALASSEPSSGLTAQFTLKRHTGSLCLKEDDMIISQQSFNCIHVRNGTMKKCTVGVKRYNHCENSCHTLRDGESRSEEGETDLFFFLSVAPAENFDLQCC